MKRPGRGTVLVFVLSAGLGWTGSARAQTSQATLQGQVTGPGGRPVARALVLLRNLATNAQAYRYTNEQGLYFFSAVLPGIYRVRVDALGHQPEERSPVELAVAVRLELNFALQASATPPAPTPTPAPPPAPASARPGASPSNLLAVMYGADAAVPPALIINLPLLFTETLVGSLSSLIDENKILELPLSGRDVYTLLVMQPGVTSDNAAGRGLGFSVHGQRAGSSNFLLDGVDNNDLLVTGPATRVSADAVQEYRMNTSNFTAEYGRASGFIANAITRTGTNGLHGTIYEFFNHDRLNANSFSYNWQRVARPPFRQNQFGGSLGGPIRRDRLFFFGNVERFRSSSQSQPLSVIVPTPLLVSLLAAGSPARQLFDKFPPPAGEPIPELELLFARKNFLLPVVEGTIFALGRLDYMFPNSGHRWSGRYSVSQQTLDNFFFNVYPGFDAPLTVRDQNVAVNYTRDVAGGSNELKFGYNRNRISTHRPHPEVPSITSRDGLIQPSVGAVVLPGMGTYTDYVFRGTVFNAVENFSRLSGRHALGMGLEWRLGFSDSLVGLFRNGYYEYESGADFFLPGTQLADLLIPLNHRTGRPGAPDDYWSYHRQNELAAFWQDNLSLTPRLTLNLGLRYEYFAVPAPRQSTQDWNFRFGNGQNVPARLASGGFESGALYRSDRNNFAPRFGFALDLLGTGRSVVRGGYGVFFDRVFSNVWLNVRNNHLPVQFLEPSQFEFSIPATQGVQPLRPEAIVNTSTAALERTLRTPYTQSWFLGFQQTLTPDVILEINHVGTLGRKLVTGDAINRAGSLERTVANPHGRYKPDYWEIAYYGNQGHSDHLAFEAALHRRWRRGVQFQLSYTYSRTRDVQSDPLDPPRLGAVAGNSAFSRSLAASNLDFIPAFIRQFDPSAEYGKSDFDQTHNLVWNAVAQVPRMRGWGGLFSGWQVAGLLGVRSGLPFTVFSAPESRTGERGVLKRADFVGKSLEEAFLSGRPEIPGGVRLLNKETFRVPTNDVIGSLPRNALRGPGFWNADVSLSRSYSVPRWSEQARLQLRIEFFNVFNHANLNNPNSLLEWDSFGNALYGRQGASSALPSVSPLNEQPRRSQFALKLYF